MVKIKLCVASGPTTKINNQNQCHYDEFQQITETQSSKPSTILERGSHNRIYSLEHFTWFKTLMVPPNFHTHLHIVTMVG